MVMERMLPDDLQRLENNAIGVTVSNNSPEIPFKFREWIYQQCDS